MRMSVRKLGGRKLGRWRRRRWRGKLNRRLLLWRWEGLMRCCREVCGWGDGGWEGILWGARRGARRGGESGSGGGWWDDVWGELADRRWEWGRLGGQDAWAEGWLREEGTVGSVHVVIHPYAAAARHLLWVETISVGGEGGMRICGDRFGLH